MQRTTIALGLLTAGCGAPRFDAGVGYGLAEVEGKVGVQNGMVTARNDLQELGLDDDEPFPGARIGFKWGSPHLLLGYAQASFSGRGTATAEISQGGTTIPAGATVDSDLDLGIGSALLTFDLVPTETYEAGIGLGVASLELDGGVRDVATGETVDGDNLFPFPVLAARGAVDLGRFDASATLSGSAIDFDGDSVRYYDVDLQARYELYAGAGLGLGWREVGADAEFEEDDADVDIDLTLRGPYLILSFVF